MSRVGEKIREERTKKGITPKQLGKKCGVTESFILDIESGRRIVNEKLLAQISKVLGVNLEESMALEPPKEEVQERVEEKPLRTIEITPVRRKEIEPLDQWEDALSNIIKRVPVCDVEMKEIKGYKSFPIIEKKVEGFHPDKLIYIEIPDDTLSQYRIRKGDRGLIYMNHELVNGAFHLIEYDGKRRLRKIKKVEGNRMQWVEGTQDGKAVTKDTKDVKILGKLIRVEIDF
ncbi:helix-turn-helix domain-containing protein [Thermotalea metallivorans]|uniref:HTH cro/C1-type domain-containing protein n=1 Tax=Thermotalea metallivorans TaxID=520762 RepID=A0A140L7S8_9FIRM|nr:XRE family transcriptional regulator [Thermotalea metallivorans]KXG76603.1 hypothetical protein AN619_09280 [Thermotalea metallivorans]